MRVHALVEYAEPSPEDREAGTWIRCSACGLDWPLSLCRPASKRCLNCARVKDRARKRRSREGEPRAVLQPERDLTVETSAGSIDLSDVQALNARLADPKTRRELDEQILIAITENGRRRVSTRNRPLANHGS